MGQLASFILEHNLSYLHYYSYRQPIAWTPAACLSVLPCTFNLQLHI